MARDPFSGPVTVGYTEGELRVVNVPPQPSQVKEVIAFFDPSAIPVVILAGGRGTRLQDVSKGILPKPMIEIGEMPLLEHIIRIYSAQGFRKFFVAAGFLKEVIVGWVDDNRTRLGQFVDEIDVVDTGEETQTGGRLGKLSDKLVAQDIFMLTYGDGVADVNLAALLEQHARLQTETSQGLVTLTAARPPARFGSLTINSQGFVTNFGEKVQAAEGLVNAGFYAVDTKILRLVAGDNSRLEYDILPILATQGRLAAFQHPGFFGCIDTWRDLQGLKELWASGNPPWARWQKN